MFACGSFDCDGATQLCSVVVSGNPQFATTYACVDFGAACHSCDCQGGASGDPSCTSCCGCHDVSGDVTVVSGSCSP